MGEPGQAGKPTQYFCLEGTGAELCNQAGDLIQHCVGEGAKGGIDPIIHTATCGER